jgi:hypothetical protein
MTATAAQLIAIRGDDRPGEMWRDIPGYTGYQASGHGRIRSVDRTVNGRQYGGMVLASRLSNKGYALVNVRADDGPIRTCSVHVLVLLAFEGPRPADKPITRHLNDDKADNRWPENICYGTRPENEADKERARVTAERDGAAAEWLTAYLNREGGSAAADDIIPAAAAAGFSAYVLYRARLLINVVSAQVTVWGYGHILSPATESEAGNVRIGNSGTGGATVESPALNAASPRVASQSVTPETLPVTCHTQ